MEKPNRSPGHRRVREAAAARYTVEASPPELTGVLLDSDVVIEVLRGRKAIVAALLALEARGVATFTCGVVVAEILAGLRAGEEAATESFFHARGDIVIDGTTGLRLWTLNRERYPMRDVRFVEA